MKHEITIRLVKKQGYFTDRFVISAKNGDQAASAAENLAAMKYDGHGEVISYTIVGIHPITDEAAQTKKTAESKKPEKSPGAKKFAKDSKPPKSRRINTVSARITKPITEKSN